MILLEAVVQIAAGPMPHAAAELRSDRPRIGIVAVRRDRSGITPVTAFADRKKRLAAARLRRSLSMTSTRSGRHRDRSHDKDVAKTRIYASSTYQLRPTLPLSASPEILRQCGRELCLLITGFSDSGAV